MNKTNQSRRQFMATTCAGTVAAIATGAMPAHAQMGKQAGTLRT